MKIVAILLLACIAAASAIGVCEYCAGACTGSSKCNDYDEGKCVAVKSACTGEDGGYAKFSSNDTYGKIQIYGTDSTCAGTATIEFSAPFGTCVPTFNAYFSDASVVAGSVSLMVVAIAALVF